MEEERAKAPGLRWNGPDRPLWRAPKSAIKAGFLPKTVNLAHLVDDPEKLTKACEKMQAEMTLWLAGVKKGGQRQFNGTFGTLLDLYTDDPESKFQSLKPASRKPYLVYTRMLKFTIGDRLIDHCSGRDAQRWFNEWKKPAKAGQEPQVAKARMAIAVLKAALSYGLMCRLPGCEGFRAALHAVRFESLDARTAVITAEQVVAVRAAARVMGHAPAALAYAIQYEGAIRQWDVRGQWIPLADKIPSAIHWRKKKWIGPTAANVSPELVLSIMPTKTDRTTAATSVIDLTACPMVMDELRLGPGLPETGPLIVNPDTGRPYTEDAWLDVWDEAAKQAGLPADLWNRDLRASGVTEGREADVPTDDIKKVVGHSARSETTSKVYDRAALEAQRRFSKARTERRKKTGA